MKKNLPWLAGLCMVAVLLKPHILWPLPFLLGAAWATDETRVKKFAISAGIVLIGGTVAGFALVSQSGSFFSQLSSFAGNVPSSQPDLSGVPGLFTHLPGGSELGYAIAGIGALGVLGLFIVGIRHPGFRALAPENRQLLPLVGLALWLACAPYAHPNDDVLIYPLLAVGLGVGGRLLNSRWLEVGFIGSLVVALSFVMTPWFGAVLLLALAVVLIWKQGIIPCYAWPSLALPALVVLPDVWPLHIIPVSLTCIPVLLVVVVGIVGLKKVIKILGPKDLFQQQYSGAEQVYL